MIFRQSLLLKRLERIQLRISTRLAILLHQQAALHFIGVICIQIQGRQRKLLGLHLQFAFALFVLFDGYGHSLLVGASGQAIHVELLQLNSLVRRANGSLLEIVVLLLVNLVFEVSLRQLTCAVAAHSVIDLRKNWILHILFFWDWLAIFCLFVSAGIRRNLLCWHKYSRRLHWLTTIDLVLVDCLQPILLLVGPLGFEELLEILGYLGIRSQARLARHQSRTELLY